MKYVHLTFLFNLLIFGIQIFFDYFYIRNLIIYLKMGLGIKIRSNQGLTCYFCSSDPTDSNYADGCSDPFRPQNVQTVSLNPSDLDDVSTACLVNKQKASTHT